MQSGASLARRHGPGRQVTVAKPSATGEALREVFDLPVSPVSAEVLQRYYEVSMSQQRGTPPTLHPLPSTSRGRCAGYAKALEHYKLEVVPCEKG